MIVSFSYPSTAGFGGGVAALYEYANGLARRGHEVHFIHGPHITGRIDSVSDVQWFAFDTSIEHHIVDSLEDRSLPSADVLLSAGGPRRLGQPAVFIQGYKMLDAAFERPAFRAPCPKLCVARWLTDVGVAWGSPPEQLLHVPLGIDHTRFALQAPLEDRPIHVAMLYSIHPVKGGSDGLAALHEVQRAHPELEVELFGMIKPEGDLPEWTTYRIAPGQAELAAQVYGRARVFVQPSWREGFGLTAVEAMASGCALVTTDNGGSRDYALDGETAIVVPRRDPEALAAAIDALLSDDVTRIRLAREGADYVKRYDWDLAAETLEGHLKRYLKDPAALQRPPSDAPLFLEEAW